MSARTLQDEAKAAIAVWEDAHADADDMAAAMERLRAAVDPLEADLIQTVEMDPSHRYLMCVWTKREMRMDVLEALRAGIMRAVKLIEQGERRVLPLMLGPDVERIELVGFEVLAAADAAVAEAGASGSRVAG